jgi:hypothetical protein
VNAQPQQSAPELRAMRSVRRKRRAFGADGQMTLSTDGRIPIGSGMGQGMVGGAALAGIRYLFSGMHSQHGSDLHGRQVQLSSKIGVCPLSQDRGAAP